MVIFSSLISYFKDELPHLSLIAKRCIDYQIRAGNYFVTGKLSQMIHFTWNLYFSSIFVF